MLCGEVFESSSGAGEARPGWVGIVTAISEHRRPGIAASWWHRVMSVQGHSSPHHRAGGLPGQPALENCLHLAWKNTIKRCRKN